MKQMTFDHIPANIMPIGGWWGPHVPEEGFCSTLKEKYFKSIRECGLNVITVSPDTWDARPDAVSLTLDLCEKYGLGTFVRHKAAVKCRSKERLAELVRPYLYRPGCIGIHFADEPRADAFPELAERYRLFEELGAANRYLYTNLFPNYGKNLSGTGEPMSFTQYAENFLRQVKPAFLSYDFYPFYRAGQGLSDCKLYFENLADAREVSLSQNVPLWTFIQAGGQWNDDGNGAEKKKIFPKLGEFLWNVNTCLAYGAKAIQYFPIIQPERFAKLKDGGRDYRKNGLFGADGRKNRFYRYAEIANRRIAAVDEYLMKAVSIGVMATGRSASLLGKERLHGPFREILRLGEGALAGCFDCEGRTMLYLVNDSVTAACRIPVQLQSGCRILLVKDQPCELVAEQVTVPLNPGEGALILLK